jgi:hypothetical protein
MSLDSCLHFVARLRRCPATLRAFRDDIEVADAAGHPVNELHFNVSEKAFADDTVAAATVDHRPDHELHLNVDKELLQVVDTDAGTSMNNGCHPVDWLQSNVSEESLNKVAEQDAGAETTLGDELAYNVNNESSLSLSVEEAVTVDMYLDLEAEDMSSGQVAVTNAGTAAFIDRHTSDQFLFVEIAATGTATRVGHHRGEELPHIVNKEPSVGVAETDDGAATTVSRHLYCKLPSAVDELSLHVKEAVAGMSCDPEAEDVAEGMSVTDNSDTDEDYNPSCDDMECDTDSTSEENSMSCGESLVPDSCPEGQ